MITVVVSIVIVGGAALAFIFFLLRSFLRPKRLESIAEMLRQGKLQQAARAAKAIVAKDPRNVDARYLLGQAYAKDNKPELALMEYKTINQIGNFGEYAREDVFRKEAAGLYKQYDQTEEALKEYILLIKMEPAVAEHYFEAGLLFEQRGSAEKSVRYYIKAIKLDPKHARAYSRLGVLLYRGNKITDAKNALSAAIKLDPDNNEAQYYLGRILKDAGDLTGALSLFEKAQKSPELKVKALVERGAAYVGLRNYDRAISELSRAVSLSAQKGSAEVLYARYFLAACYEKTRQLEKAITEWEEIYARKPQFRDVAEKLTQYQELRADDTVKDYMTSSQDAFLQMCRDAVQGLGFSVRDASNIPNGCQVIAAESVSKLRNARKAARMIWFLRVPEVITDTATRSLLEAMRKNNVPRGLIFSSSGFSRTAREFAETRPIDLYGRETLQKALNRIEVSSPQ
jgi:tetratricopeptide (TPR) repeat protein